MKKLQEFTLYPLTIADTRVHIQSDQRYAEIDLTNGRGFINKKGHQYANSWSMRRDPLAIELTPDQLIELKAVALRMVANTNKDGTLTILGGC